MKKILIINAGPTFPHLMEKFGGFESWVAKGLGVDKDGIYIIDVEKGKELPEPSDFAGAVMTGSHSMVTERLGWSEYTAQWIRKAASVKLPFLGICYGHQLMADALGGEAGYHPKGMEIGTVGITLTDEAADDPLFCSMPKVFKAHVIHSQSALKLPPGAVRLAYNGYEGNHAFRIGECAWGVQFHPEFSAEIMRGYINKYADKLADAENKIADVYDTPDASSILSVFAQLCRGK